MRSRSAKEFSRMTDRLIRGMQYRYLIKRVKESDSPRRNATLAWLEAPHFRFIPVFFLACIKTAQCLEISIDELLNELDTSALQVIHLEDEETRAGQLLEEMDVQHERFELYLYACLIDRSTPGTEDHALAQRLEGTSLAKAMVLVAIHLDLSIDELLRRYQTSRLSHP